MGTNDDPEDKDAEAKAMLEKLRNRTITDEEWERFMEIAEEENKNRDADNA